MLDKLGGDFLSRMKSMFGGEKKDQSSEMTVTAEGELAVEKFKLMAAAGSEGQAPVVTYREGNTIILSDLPMGTVLREKFSSDERPGVDQYSEPQNPHNGLRSNLYGSTTLAEATSAGL